MTRRLAHRHGERGAVLIQVTVAILGLLAFSALTIDYGVMWMSRRQAQNAADAAALAGAISMAYDAPGNYDRARAVAKAVGEQHEIFGLTPNITLGAGNSADITEDISFPTGANCTPGPTDRCVRVNVYRNDVGPGVVKDALPTFFARLFGRVTQGVKATATAQIVSGNQIECLLPFAVIDRWADNFDDEVITEFYPWDGTLGRDGWTGNDDYQPDAATGCTGGTCDEYIPPYDGNENHNGWTLEEDYGRQVVVKAGQIGEYSSGWAQQVDLPESTGSNDYKWNIENCNEQPVGLAEEDNPCTAVDEPNGCISIKTGMAQGPTSQGIGTVVDYDDDVYWDPSATGYNGPGTGAVLNPDGTPAIFTPRIRPIVILDINHYVASVEAGTCNGTTCVGKIANIIGFFVEGMCNDVTLEAGMECEDPNKDVVGRIVSLPSTIASGAGSVEESASFLTIVRLIR